MNKLLPEHILRELKKFDEYKDDINNIESFKDFRACTKKQRQYIYSLASQAKIDLALDLGIEDLKALTSKEASELINELKAMIELKKRERNINNSVDFNELENELNGFDVPFNLD